MQLAIPGSLPHGLRAMHQPSQVEIRGGHLKKIQGCPQMQQPEQRGLLVTMLNPSRRAGGRKWAPLSLPSIAGPPAASRGGIGGLRRMDSRVAHCRVVPSPGGAAAQRGRNPGSSPGARPGSAAAAPTRPGAPLGPSARRPGAGSVPASKASGLLWRAVNLRENPSTRLSAPFKTELRLCGRAGARCQTLGWDGKEKRRLPRDSGKAAVRICSPSVNLGFPYVCPVHVWSYTSTFTDGKRQCGFNKDRIQKTPR